MNIYEIIMEWDELLPYRRFLSNCLIFNDPSLEKHHIIPHSLGGEDNQENLALLTREQHVTAHGILAGCLKLTPAKRAFKKMDYAYDMMAGIKKCEKKVKRRKKGKKKVKVKNLKGRAYLSVPSQRDQETACRDMWKRKY